METHLSYHEPGKELDKNSRKLGMGEENFNSIKSIYTKHTDDLIFNGERLNSLSLLLRTRELCGQARTHELSLWFVYGHRFLYVLYSIFGLRPQLPYGQRWLLKCQPSFHIPGVQQKEGKGQNIFLPAKSAFFE